MRLNDLVNEMLPAVEEELQRVVAGADGEGFSDLHHMLAYHMGWEGEGAGPEARGKRIRPLLVLLTTSAAGGDWQAALPAAASIELIHNFSLIHDDIEDNSPLRRGRQTLWKLWGLAQAINTGDTMFSLAHQAIFRLEQSVSPQVALRAARMLQDACLSLTQGQFLDISFENRKEMSLSAYWQMVDGKTATLLATATNIGALVARAGESACEAYRSFGRSLGFAFQAQDDLLGIWGDAVLTGKSAASDLLSRKKTLPVIYGLQQNAEFARRWMGGPITAEDVPLLAELLEREGARAYTEERAHQLTEQALTALEEACPRGEAGQGLRETAQKLLGRKG